MRGTTAAWMLASAVATLSLVPLMTAGCARGAPPLDQAIPDSLLAASAFRCGAPRLLRAGADGRLRLAQALGDALLEIRPVRLTATDARFLLEEGWAAPAAGDHERGGSLNAVDRRATIRLPGLACDGPEASTARVILSIDRPVGAESGAGEEIPVRLVSAGRTLADAALGRSAPGVLLEETGASDGRERVLEVIADAPGAFALQGIALALARAPIEIDHERRDAFVASSVRRASFRIVPPNHAVLRFGIAVVQAEGALKKAGAPAEPGGGWTFRARVSADSGAPAAQAGEKEIFSERIASGAESGAGRWIDRRADLSPWAGAEIALTLEATPDDMGAPPLALWGSPIVEPAKGISTGGPVRPNILLISIDTLRGDRIGRVDGARPVTPVLNSLAEEGTRFTQCRTQAPSTLYGHAALLTGLPPAAHGATTASPLPDEVPYLPELLASAGYATAALTDDGLLDGRFGLSRGFDSFRNRFEPVEDKVRAAVNQIDSLPEPWFLFVHTYQVHVPYEPPEDLASAFTSGDGSTFGLTLDARMMIRINNGVVPVQPTDVRHIERLYDAQVARTDAALGTLFDELKSRGIWDRVIVVVTSDHGDEFDEHGVIGWHGLHCYDEVARVPLILKPASPDARGATGATGAKSAGRRIDTAVRSIDIAPTLLDLAGIPPVSTMWGSSVNPLIRGKACADRETTCEIEDGRGAMLFDGRYKYHLRTAESAADPRTFRRRVALRGPYRTEELYDLASDPGEQHDLAPSLPGRARGMRALLSARLETARAALASLTRGRTPPPRPKEDDEHLRQLRSLGYVN